MGPLHCRYIVEEGRRERGGGGGGEKKKKGTLVSLFYFLCVFWFVEEESPTPTSLHYLPRSRDTPTSEGHFFDVVLFVLLSLLTWSILGTCHISVPDVHWKKEGVCFLKSFFKPCQG